MESKTVGVLGGGQLGRMMASAAHRMGVRIVVLDPAGANSPAAQAGAKAIEGSFRDLWGTCLIGFNTIYSFQYTP